VSGLWTADLARCPLRGLQLYAPLLLKSFLECLLTAPLPITRFSVRSAHMLAEKVEVGNALSRCTISRVTKILWVAEVKITWPGEDRALVRYLNALQVGQRPVSCSEASPPRVMFRSNAGVLEQGQARSLSQRSVAPAPKIFRAPTSIGVGKGLTQSHQAHAVYDTQQANFACWWN